MMPLVFVWDQWIKWSPRARHEPFRENYIFVLIKTILFALSTIMQSFFYVSFVNKRTAWITYFLTTIWPYIFYQFFFSLAFKQASKYILWVFPSLVLQFESELHYSQGSAIILLIVDIIIYLIMFVV